MQQIILIRNPETNNDYINQIFFKSFSGKPTSIRLINEIFYQIPINQL